MLQWARSPDRSRSQATALRSSPSLSRALCPHCGPTQLKPSAAALAASTATVLAATWCSQILYGVGRHFAIAQRLVAPKMGAQVRCMLGNVSHCFISK